MFRVVSGTTSVSVSSLHPYYTYQWAVSAFTIGEGPFTPIQTITTPQDGRELIVELVYTTMILLYFLLHDTTVPSGAPQSFTALSTGVTTISLAWQLPLLADRNGIITGYTVTLSSVSSTETRQITTTYTNLTVTSLSPYTTYECIVAAYTTVGEGPPSNIILVQTQETSMSFGSTINCTH